MTLWRWLPQTEGRERRHAHVPLSSDVASYQRTTPRRRLVVGCFLHALHPGRCVIRGPPEATSIPAISGHRTNPMASPTGSAIISHPSAGREVITQRCPFERPQPHIQCASTVAKPGSSSFSALAKVKARFAVDAACRQAQHHPIPQHIWLFCASMFWLRGTCHRPSGATRELSSSAERH